ncbi:WG repeat-containing protein [Chryseobacterium sp. ERMR1:04]|uniref:WG repeat-containing protein n=1 Tax=Chryseobacterium sp. ERMR1:04 TaxID=1705393 RepID=UPI0006CDF60C|nr:WG repeat-containing protein [Chryseobacterium sp. ERMR1:04]KPH15135.1 hypothetical protein AMQ68_06995 [Chryseobacterium sp. ERMR1:04]
MKNIIYCLLMIMFLFGKGQNKKDLFLLPYQVGDKWGLADTLGNIKVKPQYDEMIDFSIEPRKHGNTPPYSFYYVRKNNEIFFIDAGNNRYFKDYEIVKSQNNERGVFFKKNGKIGIQSPFFEDGKWKLVGDPSSYKYDNIYTYPQTNSLFTFVEINKKEGLMFYNGEIIIPVEYDSISYTKSQDVWEFSAYQLDGSKKITQTKKYTKRIDLPPPPGILKNKNANLLERKEMDALYKESYNLINYKHVYYYRDRIPAIVKDNNSEKFGIVATFKPEKIDFLYDDIFAVEYHVSGEKERYKAYAFKKGNSYGLFDRSENKYLPYPDQYDLIEQKYYTANDINSSAPPYEMPYLVFSKKNKYGADNFNIKLFNMIPFEYDDIIDRNIIIKNKMFGIWDNTPFRMVHIAPKYHSKPKLIKEISLPKGKTFVFEVLNKENKKIWVYRNGLELYKGL